MNVKEFLEAGYKFEVGDVFAYEDGETCVVQKYQLENCNEPSKVDCILTIIKSAQLERERRKEGAKRAQDSFVSFVDVINSVGFASVAESIKKSGDKMKRHPYADLFTAKLNNEELVLIEKHRDWEEWKVQSTNMCVMIHDTYEYFLCLPQHKEACLHYLNGGTIEVKSDLVGKWTEVCRGRSWRHGTGWMREDAQYRIKPKKEKRWIGVHPDGHCGGTHFDGYAKAENDSPVGYQIIEIEVEV